MPSDLAQYPYEEIVDMMKVYEDEIKQEQEWKKLLLKSNGAKIR